MNKELNIFTMRMLRDQYHAEHLDTEAEALEAAISALEQPELIEQGAYVRGFEQGRTQGMLDAKLQPTCNQLATDCISRQAAIDAMSAVNDSICEQQAIDALCELPSAQPEQQWIPCSECMYWRDERVLMNDGKARQYNGDEPDELGIKHSVSIEIGINQGSMCLYEEGRGWSTDHTTFRNADDFCSRAKKRPCSYEEWYGIVDGVYAEPWRGEQE